MNPPGTEFTVTFEVILGTARGTVNERLKAGEGVTSWLPPGKFAVSDDTVSVMSPATVPGENLGWKGEVNTADVRPAGMVNGRVRPPAMKFIARSSPGTTEFELKLRVICPVRSTG